MPSASSNQRGMALMALAMALYVLNDTFIKLVTGLYPTGQILAVRGLFATALVLAIAAGAGALAAWRQALRPIMATRAALEVMTAAASVVALSLLPIATVTAIMLASPLIVALAVVALRMEAPDATRLALAGLGFVGVLLVVQPAPDTFDGGALVALVVAFGLAGRDLVTRRMPAEIPSGLIALVTTAITGLAGLALASVEEWQPLRTAETLYLVAAAGFAALGNYALILACRDVDLSVVAPFRYTILLWAILMGALVWGDLPDAVEMAGMALIALAGVAILRRNRKPVPKAGPT